MRPLTPAGCLEARVAGRALRALGAAPAHVLASPLVRAQETAAIIAAELGVPATPLAELANGHSTPALLAALGAWANAAALVLVGHMPGLTDHVAALTGTGIGFLTGAVARVEWGGKLGGGELRWWMRPNELRAAAARAGFPLA